MFISEQHNFPRSSVLPLLGILLEHGSKLQFIRRLNTYTTMGQSPFCKLFHEKIYYKFKLSCFSSKAYDIKKIETFYVLQKVDLLYPPRTLWHLKKKMPPALAELDAEKMWQHLLRKMLSKMLRYVLQFETQRYGTLALTHDHVITWLVNLAQSACAWGDNIIYHGQVRTEVRSAC